MSDLADIDAAQIVGAMANPIVARVWQLAEPLCAGEGMQLIHVAYHREQRGRILRLYMDKPNGVSLDDCVNISRQLNDILDVGLENEASYRLEVSSPGADRPLGRRDDFERCKGRRIKIRLAIPVKGQKSFTGVLNDISAQTVRLAINNGAIDIDFTNIVKANLIE